MKAVKSYITEIFSLSKYIYIYLILQLFRNGFTTIILQSIYRWKTFDAKYKKIRINRGKEIFPLIIFRKSISFFKFIDSLTSTAEND